ncbi:MAG: cytochrome c [Gemmatimonadetes bacterium]|nr:cytochrome c [Gemmatimonadota bacterium]MYH19967.1 cytochrome c [Gemmatimonadota bacterium]MYK97464.1 cytochrome c [Gemmatimonadota bacterium]
MFSVGTTWLKLSRALRLRGGMQRWSGRWLRGGMHIAAGMWFVVVLLLLYTGCGSSGSDTEPADPEDRAAVARAFLAQLVEGTVTPGTIGFHEIPWEFVQEGKALYARYGCTVCHGMDGHGDGPISYTLKPPPRDFRDPGAYRIGRDVVTIARTLRDGMPDSPSMVPFPHIKDEERFKIAMYVASLQPPSDAPSFYESPADAPSP